MMAPRIETTQGAMAPAQMVKAPTTLPQYPPPDSYNQVLFSMAYPTKSARIRKMHGDGYTTSQISKHLGVLYQHARNVLNQIIKRRPEDNPTTITHTVFVMPQVDEEKIKAAAEQHGLTEEEVRQIVTGSFQTKAA